MRGTTTLLRQLFSVVILLACTRTASSALVTAWETTGALGSETTFAATSSAAHVTGLSLARSGVAPSGASNNFGSVGWQAAAAANPADDLNYISFGFNVAAGYKVSLTDLHLATRSSGTGPGTVGLYYSGDSYASPLASFTEDGTNYVNAIVGMSTLTNLTGAVEFRLIEIGNTRATGGSATASTGTFRVGDYFDGSSFSAMQFNGSVTAVPEPSTLLLSGVGLIGLATLSRIYRKRGQK